MKQIFAFFIGVLFLSACQNNTVVSNQSNANRPAANNTAANVSNLSAAAANHSGHGASQPTAAATNTAPDIKRVQAVGKVTKINMELGSVELDHEEIKGIMPAMIMEFYVADPKELEKLKVGDKVNFTLEDNKGAEKITQISKSE